MTFCNGSQIQYQAYRRFSSIMNKFKLRPLHKEKLTLTQANLPLTIKKGQNETNTMQLTIASFGGDSSLQKGKQSKEKQPLNFEKQANNVLQPLKGRVFSTTEGQEKMIARKPMKSMSNLKQNRIRLEKGISSTKDPQKTLHNIKSTTNLGRKELNGYIESLITQLISAKILMWYSKDTYAIRKEKFKDFIDYLISVLMIKRSDEQEAVHYDHTDMSDLSKILHKLKSFKQMKGKHEASKQLTFASSIMNQNYLPDDFFVDVQMSCSKLVELNASKDKLTLIIAELQKDQLSIKEESDILGKIIERQRKEIVELEEKADELKEYQCYLRSVAEDVYYQNHRIQRQKETVTQKKLKILSQFDSQNPNMNSIWADFVDYIIDKSIDEIKEQEIEPQTKRSTNFQASFKRWLDDHSNNTKQDKDQYPVEEQYRLTFETLQ